MSAETDSLLELRDVGVHFTQQDLFGLGGSSTVRAVDGVSMDIGENDVVALVGESGCGKTTLGKTAIGAQRPDAGSVLYRGHDIWEVKDRADSFTGRFRANGEMAWSDIRRSLQIIHQDPGSSLNPNQTIEATLSEPLQRWNPELSGDDRQARIYSFLEYVGMTPPGDFAERYPHQLSGGEQQRVALIRALLMNPDLILADEAVSALDVSLRVEMMDLMLDLQEEFATSFLLIAHDFGTARYIAENAGGRIGVMYMGELVEIGPAQEIIDDPRHPYTQALRWATPELFSRQRDEPNPLRAIEIPDAANPPDGCRFHTRCPEAREACVSETPIPEDAGPERSVACFRENDTHPYWDSDPLKGTEADDS
jgi:peptide/nickel transport system ATP-binding protein